MSEIEPPKKLPSVPLRSRVTKPHPAVSVLQAHPRVMDVPAAERTRAIRIAHTLVEEALARGWQVVGCQSMESAAGYEKQPQYGAATLFTIDAGSEPVSVRIRMKLKRERRIPEPREIFPRRWDHVPTDVLRVELRRGIYDVFNYEDSPRKRADKKIAHMLWRIQRISDQADEQSAAHAAQAARRAENERNAEVQANRLRHRREWVAALESIADWTERQRRLWDGVAALERTLVDRNGREHAAVKEFVEWARRYLEADERDVTSNLPRGVPPT